MSAADQMFDIRERVAVVTGASSGLGACFARTLAGCGAKVVVAGRRQARLQELVDDVGAERALAVTADVTEDGALAHVVAEAMARFGRLDIMVNNAGDSDGGPAESQDLRSFQAILDVNLVAVFAGCREAARVMLPVGRGSIINIASIAGFVSLAERHRMAAYAASKSAVVGLTRELGAQWAQRGVRVNAIAPGWFPSEMTGQLADEQQRRWIEERTPIARAGRIDELDGALVYLASDASSFVIGHTLVVDGGWTIW